MAFDSPIGYTAHYQFPKFALGAHPGADALNNLFESIDTKIYEATQVSGSLTFSLPLVKNVNAISLQYEDNLILSAGNKLDTVQPIKTTSKPRFEKIAIGGAIDENYFQKIYGNQKITGNIVVDGDIYIGGVINQVNVVDLDIADHAVRLNKNGDNTTALNGGIEMLGASNALLASISYNGSAWLSDINFDLGNGKVYKINGTQVLSATALGSSVVNSSLQSVGTLTSGVWSATAILPAKIATDSSNRFVTDTQITNWNAASSNNHSHTNKALLDTYTQSEANLADAVSKKHTHTNITYLDAINQSLATTATPTFAGATLTNTLTSQSIVPNLTDTYDLGSFTKYFSNAYISQIQATIFAENTISAIGGYLYITKGQGTLPAVSSSQTAIDFGQTMTVNDFVIIKAKDASGNYKTEYIKIVSQSSGTIYNVTRDYANAHVTDPSWTDGTVYVVIGQDGNGRIEINAYDTPRISVIKQGSNYNAQTELIRLGDLNGMPGYSTELYGVFMGDENSYFKYDQVGGAVFKGNGSGLTTINGGNISTNTITLNQLNFTPVQTSNVVASINASAEGVRISGSKIIVDGNVSFSSGYNPTTKISSGGAAADVNANVTTISGGKITSNTITTTQLNFTPVQSTNVVASINASVEGVRISGSKIIIDGNVSFSSGYDPTGRVAVGGSATDINNGVTTISGGKITANSISVDKLIAGTLTGYTVETAIGTTNSIKLEGANNRIAFYYGGYSSFLTPYVSGNGITLSGQFNATGAIYSDGNVTGYDVVASNRFVIPGLKFVVNSSGQITKVNNTSPTNKYALIGDGFSFTPRLISASDIDANISDTEFSYLNGVTSAIQNQLDNKASSSHNHDSSYAAVSHSHAISDITNLQTTLNNKSSVSLGSTGGTAYYGTGGNPIFQINANTRQITVDGTQITVVTSIETY